MNKVEFVIFDLDGTLVDSEKICNQAFIDLLSGLGELSTVEALIQMNRGRRLAEILSGIEKTFGLVLDADFESRYRKRVEELFDTELQPIEGVPEMLEALDLPKCIASSGPPSKIHHALEICGLSKYFEGKIYSSYEVQSWKPDPGLSQYAMSDAGYHPEQCAVIEDSDVGIKAAKSAGVRAFLYAPERPFSNVNNCIVFQSMTALAGLIACKNDFAQHTSPHGDAKKQHA